jgi:hypothetical protein
MINVKFASEIRICPLCEMQAIRIPESDTETEIAFQCQTGLDRLRNPHPVFREPMPNVKEVIKNFTAPVKQSASEAVTTVIAVIDSLSVADVPTEDDPVRQHRKRESK